MANLMGISKKTYLVFLSPAIILYFCFVLAPIAVSLIYSFTDLTGFNPHFKIIGIENWVRLIKDSRLWNSVKVTLIFTVILSASSNLLAILLAFILEKLSHKLVKNTARSIFLLPTVLTPVIVGFIWYYIFMAFKSISNVDLVGTSKSLYGIILVTMWLHMGICLIIYIAAMNNVSTDLYESASIDGATSLQSFLHITVPLIVPAFLLNIVNTLILGFRQFDQIWSMTKGGPGTSSETMSLYIYYIALRNNDYGYGSAIAFLLFIMVMVISVFIIKFFKSKEVDK